MSSQKLYIRGLPKMIILGIAFGLVGMMVASAVNVLPLLSPTYLVPAPYRIPKIPGGTALRMAMVHDVLHERYLRHGTAWYTQRVADARKILAAESDPKSEKSLDAMDDLAVGLERIGQLDEAIAVMRKKAELVGPLPAPTKPATVPTDLEAEADDLVKITAAQNLSQVDRQKYTTCANLGTILVHQAMHKAMTGDKAAIAQVREALDWIERAIAINPGAHFGRERWQAIAMEDLLAATEHPEILGKFDLIGDSLHPDDGDDFFIERDSIARQDRFARDADSLPRDSDLSLDRRISIRRSLARVGANPDWSTLVHGDYYQKMPFDEPVLAMIGMWTLGGGPNAHFALAFGRIMEGVDQPEIAWNAYERAIELKDTFWPDEKIQQQMVDICRERQANILKFFPEAPDTLRQQHRDELAWGIAYQTAYHDFEAKQIAAGVPLDDPHFYDAFFKDRPPIASDPGLADDLLVRHRQARLFSESLPLGMLGMGVGMLLALIRPDKPRPA